MQVTCSLQFFPASVYFFFDFEKAVSLQFWSDVKYEITFNTKLEASEASLYSYLSFWYLSDNLYPITVFKIPMLGCF